MQEAPLIENFCFSNRDFFKIMRCKIKKKNKGLPYYFLIRWQLLGTTQVPDALHTTTGSGRTSAAEAEMSVRGAITFLASKTLVRELLPTWVISPTASIKSPAYTGAKNSTLSYAQKSPSSPS